MFACGRCDAERVASVGRERCRDRTESWKNMQSDAWPRYAWVRAMSA